jgi:heterodisulfide reductase subunit C
VVTPRTSVQKAEFRALVKATNLSCPRELMRGKIVVVFFFFVTAKSSCKLCGMKGHSKRFCSTVPKSGDDMVLESKKVESKKMESKKMESKKMESKKKLGEEENLVQVAKMEEEVEDENDENDEDGEEKDDELLLDDAFFG